MVMQHHASLVYDSARTDVRMGARSGAVPDRSLLFRVGEYVVDLLVQSGHGDVQIVQGQVLGSSGREPVRGARVVADGGEVQVTDDLGEFALLLRGGKPSALSIETAGCTLACSVPVVRIN